MEIGERIRMLRKMNGYSQEELGRRIGVQKAAINKYEKGVVTNIPIQTIEKLANVLDVSPVKIVGWNGTSTEKLSAEVETLLGVKNYFGEDCVDLLETFTSLTETGKKRLLNYADELLQLYAKPM